MKLNPLLVGGATDEKLKAMLEILEDPRLEHEWKVITVSRELRKLLTEKNFCCDVWIDWHYKNPEALKLFRYCPFCGEEKK